MHMLLLWLSVIIMFDMLITTVAAYDVPSVLGIDFPSEHRCISHFFIHLFPGVGEFMAVD